MYENKKRTRREPEYELIDTGIFDDNRYFDVFVEYAKADEEDILCKIEAVNRGPVETLLHLLPSLWFRNTWSWGYEVVSSAPPEKKPSEHSPRPLHPRPFMRQASPTSVDIVHRHLGKRYYYIDPEPKEILFTENNTNHVKIYGEGAKNETKYVKDGINDAVVDGHTDRCNPEKKGTKAASWYQFIVPPGESAIVKFRFTRAALAKPFTDFDAVIAQRKSEADDFYGHIQREYSDDKPQLALIQRQAFGGLLWSKKYYHYGVELWLSGDPAFPPPPDSRLNGRNSHWKHLYCNDVISVPDKFEYVPFLTSYNE